MAHRVAQIYVHDLPSVTLELMDDHIAEVLVVDRIVRAQCRSIVVEHHRLVLMVGIVGTEIIYQSGDLSFKFDVERF